MKNQEIETKNKKGVPWRLIFLVFIVVLGSFAIDEFSSGSFSGQISQPESSIKEAAKKEDSTSINEDFSKEEALPNQTAEIISENEQPQEEEAKNIYLAPDFVSEDIFGNRVSLSDFQGKKPVLLVFWATWCGYCAKEFSDLKTFNEEHKDEIQIIAIASGEPRKTIKDYIEEKDVDFLIVLDENREIWNTYLVRGTPSHFLIDKKGEVVTLWPGLASKELLETLLTMVSQQI